MRIIHALLKHGVRHEKKFDVAHSGYKDGQFEYEEVLAYLPDGKVYLDKQGHAKERSGEGGRIHIFPRSQ